MAAARTHAIKHEMMGNDENGEEATSDDDEMPHPSNTLAASKQYRASLSFCCQNYTIKK
jgi:hypothetical protein